MRNNLKSKIEEEVEKREREIVEFLQQLIRINSETGKEAEIQDFLANSLVNMGLKVDKFIPDKVLLEKQPGYFPVEFDYKNRPNVVGVMDGTGGGKSLILNGHVDTIPAEPITAWDIGPFSGEVRNGKVFGRGASDMKSGIAAMTMAVKILKEMKLPLKGLNYTRICGR